MQALLSLRAAGDHALAVADLLGRRQAASLTVSRGCLEAASWAAHLADATLYPSERARIQVNEVLYGISEQGRALFDYGNVEEAAHHRERIEVILKAAATFPDWGQPQDVSQDWRSAARVGPPRPNVMSLIDRLLATDDGKKFGSQVYRVASAVAHTSPHGFLLSGAVMPSRYGLYQVPDPSPWTRDRWATLLLPAVGGFFNGSLVVFDRMAWDLATLRDVAAEVLPLWMEAARPGSSRALVV